VATKLVREWNQFPDTFLLVRVPGNLYIAIIAGPSLKALFLFYGCFLVAFFLLVCPYDGICIWLVLVREIILHQIGEGLVL